MSTSPESPHAVIVCDLDHFKTINDTYDYYVGRFGHPRIWEGASQLYRGDPSSRPHRR
ncbi:hypothetical protein RMS29_024000 (plasmid) [Agrobacterium rosae]|uniref:hypothetical protein n=1 Tax=Agrobacterium rosae TaxID=1972867 RepID=UPI00387B4D25